MKMKIDNNEKERLPELLAFNLKEIKSYERNIRKTILRELLNDTKVFKRTNFRSINSIRNRILL